MTPSRIAAFKALGHFRRDGSWTDLYLKKQLNDMTSEDAALATTITYGVLQNMYLIDFYISKYSSVKLKKIMPQVLDAMRCGVYQILFLDKIPMFAAVNETVSIIKKNANPRAASFANAVLRKICANKDNLPPIEADNKIGTLSIKYSHPEWLVNKLSDQYGVDVCERVLQSNNDIAPVYIRVNTLKISTEELISILSNRNIDVKRVDGLANALICNSTTPLHLTDEFLNGLFYIQDIASQLAIEILGTNPGDRVIDMCSAPGGKSLIAAQFMENKGQIKAFDLHSHKISIINENSKKYGVDIIDAKASDSSKLDNSLLNWADRIICDVPCSGIGIIRKKPDIRYKNPQDIADLPSIQLSILKNASKYLKSGGRLVYSTCTILKEENEDVINKFLNEEKDFSLASFDNSVCGKTDGMVTLLPHINKCDGFFIAVLDRK